MNCLLLKEALNKSIQDLSVATHPGAVRTSDLIQRLYNCLGAETPAYNMRGHA